MISWTTKFLMPEIMLVTCALRIMAATDGLLGWQYPPLRLDEVLEDGERKELSIHEGD